MQTGTETPHHKDFARLHRRRIMRALGTLFMVATRAQLVPLFSITF